MSTARPHGVLQNGFDLVDDDERVLATFAGSVWGERGTVTVAGREWDFTRGGGRLLLTEAGRPVAYARRRGLLSPTWEIGYDGRVGTLTKRGVRSPRYELSDEAGTPLGAVTQRSWTRRALDVRLPDALRPETQAFVAAVALTLMRRARSAGA
jgi:hypothetical protein